MSAALRSARHTVGYWGLRGLLGAARALPPSLLVALGRAGGRLASLSMGRESRRAFEHLEAAFPDRDRRWRARLAAACASHLGTLLGEVAWLWSASADDILARTEFVGLEHLTGACDAGGGAVFVTAHCGNWEWMNLALGAAGVPMTVAAREVYDPRLDVLVQRLRGRFGGQTVLRGQGAGQRLARALRGGRVVGLLIDQDIDAPGVFVEFFGRPAWTPSGAALLALRTRRPCVPGFAARKPNGVMQLCFDAALELAGGGALEDQVGALTARLSARIEKQVRSNPEQWVWMHRRWRRQPGAGEKVWRAGPAGAVPAGGGETAAAVSG
ncbi:MAG: lysophospholipid acyltransferase family protein [Acidobacteriota bacterium]